MTDVVDHRALEVARRLLASLDLTSLNPDDTEADIDTLCTKGLDGRFGVRPAALCVAPRFARQVSSRLAGSGIATAVVANFPGGDAPVADVVAEVGTALADGADEIDVVLPYRALMAGHTSEALALVWDVVEICRAHHRRVVVKVILETGVLEDPGLIAVAARGALEAGADFVKTSTGKVEPGATSDAVRVLLEVIVEHRRHTGHPGGLKVSGGVRTLVAAGRFLELADAYFAPTPATPANFRIGASGLYDELAGVLATADGSDPREGVR